MLQELEHKKYRGYLTLVTWLTNQSIKILQCNGKKQSCFYKGERQDCTKCKEETKAFLLDENGIIPTALCSMGYTDTIESYWFRSKYKDLVIRKE